MRRNRRIRGVCVPLRCRPRGLRATIPLPHRHHRFYLTHLKSNQPSFLPPMRLRIPAPLPRVRAPSLSPRVICSLRFRPTSLWDSAFLRYHPQLYNSPQLLQLLPLRSHNRPAAATSRQLKLHSPSRWGLAVVPQRPTQRQHRT